jgi:hypothetical protein
MTTNRRLPAKRKARSGRDSMARQRGIRALELKTKGWTLSQIAQELGYASKSGPSAAIDRELNRWSYSAADTDRRVTALQYDGLVRDAYEDREHCKTLMDRLWYTDRIRGLLADKRKLLGLDLGEDEKRAGIPYRKIIELHHDYADPALPPPGEIVDEG